MKDHLKPYFCLLLIFFSITIFKTYGQSDSIVILESMIPDAKTDREKLDIYFTLADKLVTTNPEKGTDYAFKALYFAELVNEKSTMAGVYSVVALNLNYSGFSDSALLFAKRAYSIMQQGEAGKYAFTATNTMGNIHAELSNLDSSLHYYNLSLRVASEEENRFKMAATYNNLAMTLSDKGELQQAYEYYLKAMEHFEQLEDINNLAITLNNIATVNQQNLEFRKAIHYLNRAVEMNSITGDHYHQSMNYSNLGISYKELESYDTALMYHQKSQNINKKYGFTSDYARNYFNMGNMYYEIDEYDSARVYFEKSIDLSERQGVKIGLLYNHMRLFDLSLMNGETERAKKSLQIIGEIIEETGHLQYVDELLLRKSNYYEAIGDEKQALETYKEYHDYTDSLKNLDYRGKVAELQEKFETEKTLRENQELKDQNLIQEKTIHNQRLTGIFIAVSLLLVILIAVTLYLSMRKLGLVNNALKELNQEIYAQKDKLQEASETKDKMFSIIAHDLRSPFNTLIGYLDILISDFDEMDDVEKKQILKTLNSQSLKTFGLLENLLQWSMMQRGMIKLDIMRYNLHQVVWGQISDLQPRAGDKNIELINKVPPDMQIMADEVMINTILRNLINNSIKFSYPGGKVRVEAIKSNDTIRICVIDEGMGMSSKKADDLFTKFIPESTPGTKNETGTGLGLRIVKDFVNMLDGEITVKSKPGGGSVFCVALNKQHAEKESVILNS